MRLSLPLILTAAACSAVSGFSPSLGARLGESSAVSSLYMTEAPCDVPSDVINPDLVSQKGSGKLLRSAMLTNADGEVIRLGDKMGNGTSVVVYLRHMG